MPIDDVAALGFDAGASAYEAARPGYPEEALAVVAEATGLGPGTAVCDVAAGTGKLTRLLIARGADVVAVEPVAGMRAQFRTAVPGVEVLEGQAEGLPLDDGSVDVVTVAQAFHWFDASAALAEAARVLRPGGHLVLVWNERDESTPWVAEMSRLIRWHERTVSRYQHVDWTAVVSASGRFGPLQTRTVAWDQPMTRQLLGDRVRSISYVAAMPEPERERLATEVVTLVARRVEPFPFPYLCRVLWARVGR